MGRRDAVLAGVRSSSGIRMMRVWRGNTQTRFLSASSSMRADEPDSPAGPGATTGGRWCRRPVALSSSMRPPCSCTMRATMDRPRPGALAVVLGGEEGQEDLVAVLGGDALAGVARTSPGLAGIARARWSMSMRPPSRHGVQGVGQRLKKTCSSSLRLPYTQGSVARRISTSTSATFRFFSMRKTVSSHDLGQVDAAAVAARGPREVQQTLDDAAALLGLADDAADVLGVVLVLDRVLEHLRRQQDRAQRRVQLVGDARGELADARQLLGLAHARFRAASREVMSRAMTTNEPGSSGLRPGRRDGCPRRSGSECGRRAGHASELHLVGEAAAGAPHVGEDLLQVDVPAPQAQVEFRSVRPARCAAARRKSCSAALFHSCTRPCSSSRKMASPAWLMMVRYFCSDRRRRR